jgi:hypothetical protein
MAAADWARGVRVSPDDVLGVQPGTDPSSEPSSEPGAELGAE